MSPCQRCGDVAELGACPRCRRDLCLACYDSDQTACSSLPPVAAVHQRIHRLRAEGSSIREIARAVGRNKRTVNAVLAKARQA